MQCNFQCSFWFLFLAAKYRVLHPPLLWPKIKMFPTLTPSFTKYDTASWISFALVGVRSPAKLPVENEQRWNAITLLLLIAVPLNASITLPRLLGRHAWISLQFRVPWLNRITILIEKNFSGKCPKPGKYNKDDLEIITFYKSVLLKVEKNMKELKIHDALETIFSLIREIN